jgi:hypothetical protein
VALCEQNFKDAVNGDLPTAATENSAKAFDPVVECADYCRDEDAAAKARPYTSSLVRSI